MIQSTVNVNQAKPLPDGWRWVRLGDVCMINPSRPNGFTRLPDASTTFVPMAAVDGNLGVISKPESRSYSEVSTGYTYFGEADVLFAKITPCMQNGKHAIARNLLDGIGFGSTEFHVIRTSALILPEWIHFFIRQPYFLREATSYFVGAVGQQRVPESFLANYGISLPPLPEQKRIVAKVEGLMAEVEHARTACEARLEAARALPQAYLCQVFETEEAKKWERRRLGEVCEEVYRYPTYYSIEYVERGIPEIRGELIKKDGTLETDLTKYRFISKETSEGYSRTVLREGDFVLSVRGSMGKVALVPNELDGANMTANLIRISPNRTFVYSPFLKLIFLSNYFQNALEELSPQTTIRTIKAPMLRSISIALPPLTEQKRIAIELQAKMEEAEKLKTSIEKELEAIKALPQAILRKAFRGEL